MVTLNLYNFLWRMHAEKQIAEGYAELIGLDSPEYIWIDAICINQEDLEERSIQVARMYSIYDNAQSVLIWLGEHDGFYTIGSAGHDIAWQDSSKSMEKP